MQGKLIVLGILVVFVAGVFAYDYFAKPEKITSTIQAKTMHLDFPNVEFTQFDGSALNVHELKEPVVLLNFWATWCTTCIAKMPSMLSLVEKMQGQVALVTVSIDDTQAEPEAYRAKIAETPHVYWVWDKDRSISLNQFNVLKTPETIVINKDRQMVEKIVGAYDWSPVNFQNLMKKL